MRGNAHCTHARASSVMRCMPDSQQATTIYSATVQLLTRDARLAFAWLSYIYDCAYSRHAFVAGRTPTASARSYVPVFESRVGQLRSERNAKRSSERVWCVSNVCAATGERGGGQRERES